MRAFRKSFKQLDRALTQLAARHGITALRVSLGVVFLWFGVLKFFPGMSPAQDIAIRTIDVLTQGALPPRVGLNTLAAWESLIGLGLIFGVALRTVILLLIAQMIGTLTPLFLFPSDVFYRVPFAPTLEGQYIIKNLVLLSAALVIGATVRGGALIADPVAAAEAQDAS